MRYVIRDDIPFQGSVHSVLTPDGLVAWSGGLTLEQYAAERGFPVRVVEEDEIDALVKTYTDGLVQAPREISEQDYEQALGVLPPCRWTSRRGVEMFHISERLTHDIVAWHTRAGDRFFAFYDRAGASLDHIADKTLAALATGKAD